MKNLGAELALEPLNEREREILRLLADGLTNREIGQSLFIALETVKWYNKQIYSKLGVSNRTQAAARAKEYGLLDAPQEAMARPRHNLPVQLTSFVGREQEIASITRLLGESRLLTLTGPGGTGKTRLAIHVATGVLDAFAGGVFFVDLAPIRRAELVPDTIATVLGIKQTAGESITVVLNDYFSSKQLLLVLDNFEHLLEAAPLTVELLTASPGLTILATSREPLRVYGEQEYAVPPLALPDLDRSEPPSKLSDYEAVALFIQRVKAVKPNFALTATNAPTVAEICVRLDGLPLALELGAGRAKLFSPQALLGQLESRFAVLRGGPRGLPARQRTLRGMIEWSYDLLDNVEQVLFARLAVFQGGRSIDAVEAVCCSDLSIHVLDGLTSLLNKNLLRRENGPEGEPRFVMLETIHEYAREMLEQSGERASLHRRHAEYFATLVERAEPHTRGGPDQVLWLRRLEADYDNLRAALEWSHAGGDVELGLRLTGCLSYFWFRQGYSAEAQRWTSRALAVDTGEARNAPLRAMVLFAAALVAWSLNDFATAERMWRESLAIYQELGDQRNAGWTLIWLGSYGGSNTYDTALELIEEGLLLLRAVGDTAGVTQGLNILGEVARMHQDYARAKAAYEECLVLAREAGDIMRETLLVGNLGYLTQYQGDAEGARRLYHRSLRISLEIDFEPHAVCSLAMIGGVESDLGRPERAARLISAALTLIRERGYIVQPSDLPDLERSEAAAREQLDRETFEAAWAAGQGMKLEEAVAYALSGPEPGQQSAT